MGGHEAAGFDAVSSVFGFEIGRSSPRETGDEEEAGEGGAEQNSHDR